MKKPFIIFSVFIILVSVLVYSCGTKNDPPVPTHDANISTSGNSIQLVKSGSTYTFNLGYKSCTIDSSLGIHFLMTGKDLNSNFMINTLLYDASAPSTGSSYTIVSVGTTLSSGQCYVFVSVPTISSSQFVATGGSLNYSAIGGNPSATITNVQVINVSDSSTATVSGNWTCQ